MSDTALHLVLARVSTTVLDAIRERPELVAGILTVDGGERFVAGFAELEATAAEKASRAWFDTAVNGTEPLGYDAVTDGPAFALGVDDVRAVAVGLVDEGWAPGPGHHDDADADVDATARTLGAAAGWDPDEFATYGPMLAGSWSPDFLHRLVRAVGAAGGWSEETTERVHVAVAVPTIVPRGGGLAACVAAAARTGQAVVGGLVEQDHR
ncbi:hypothetical protein GCM10009557_95940 [Virgisporangium ochraceum]